MGIESDKLVFDYLSRIGDLAHSTPMTAAERARLVNGLRGEIDRMRAEQGGADSKAAVKRILGRLGRPEDIVAARGGGGASADGGSYGSGSYTSGSYASGEGGSGGPASSGGSNGPRSAGSWGGTGLSGGTDGTDTGSGRKISLRKSGWAGKVGKLTKGGKEPDEPAAPPPPTASYGASAPHLAGLDELGPGETDPDWWRVDASPFGEGGGQPFGPVPGFVGGIEVPELLKPPPGAQDEDGKDLASGTGKEAVSGRIPVPAARKPLEPKAAGPDDEAAAGAGTGPAAAGLRRLLPTRRRLTAGGPRAGGVVELAAVVLLLAGAAVGSLIPLGAGWLAAWWSPRLRRTEAKWAAAGMPGLVVIGTMVWLWGRSDRRWGEPLRQGGDALGQALTETWPVLLRIAAVASALFLLWRARRPRV